MAPPRKHDTDHILDAARDLVLAKGPRAASVSGISGVSNAPVGTLYHRFGSRDDILAAVWLRAVERFQMQALAARRAHPDDAVEAGVAMATASLTFATRHPADARLLVAVRRKDLLDEIPDGFQPTLDAINAPLQEAIAAIARDIHGRADARAVEAVTRAVVDLPGAAVRRHVRDDSRPLPRWLAQDVAGAARALLQSHVA